MPPDRTTLIATISASLSYCASTGAIVRIASAQRPDRIGTVAGVLESSGYIRIAVGGKNVRAHQVAWVLMTGRFPVGMIDHINGNRSDNRWSNLRDVSNQINSQNERAARASNKTSGLLGVTWDEQAGKWKAQIKVGKNNKNLGLFDDPLAGHEAYKAAKRVAHAGATI